MHNSGGERPRTIGIGVRQRELYFFNVWDPREHPEKRQQPEGGAAGRHERCPELDAGGRRTGRQHGRPKVSSAQMKTCYNHLNLPLTRRQHDESCRDTVSACAGRVDPLMGEQTELLLLLHGGIYLDLTVAAIM